MTVLGGAGTVAGMGTKARAAALEAPAATGPLARLKAKVHHPPVAEANEWPWWAGACAVLPAAGILLISLLQWHAGPVAHGQALGAPALARHLATAVVLLPWLLDAWPGRKLPRLVFLAMALPSIVILGHQYSAGAVWFLLIYLVAEFAFTCPWRISVPVFVLAEAIIAIEAFTIPAPFLADDWTGWFLGLIAGAGSGWVGRSQRRVMAELRAAQYRLADKAVLAERQRIARELHDVVAHSLTVTMLHLTGARLSLRSDPDDAEAALEEAERVGRQSLADVRRTVALLGPGDGAAPAPPLPGVHDLEALVAGYAAAGLPVHLETEGDIDDVSGATGLGLYRISQESLANAARHAPGAGVTVRLSVKNGAICLRVRNGAAAASVREAASAQGSGGFGLAGMKERADLLGGRLRTGPEGDGWVVEVTIPRSSGWRVRC